MGRPGLDPGTLGFDFSRLEASVVVRVSWSDDGPRSRTSAEVLPNMLPWLQDWLHDLDGGASGVIQVCGSDGRLIEVRIGRATSGSGEDSGT